jgi:crotonobetainyl-CoA:carnitine CoA-transferase CaiB-like acyl-CoA transferase
MDERRTDSDDTERRAVLDGIRVADFSRVLAGPYATMMLADFGADVIKIESPLGDDTRAWVPPVDDSGMSTYFGGLNRNKRSVVCDLRTASGLAEARRLALSADVVVENFRDGVMERFGLDEASLRQENPGVVYCSITGFGRGAGAALPGYDLLVQAVGGLMSITGEPEGEPSKVGVALVDVLTGLNAFSGILLALRARDAGEEGGRVEVDLMTTLLSALTNQAASTLATGVAPPRLGNAHPSIAPYEVFMAADRRLVIAVGNDRQFCALTEVLGVPALAADERFARNEVRVHNRELLRSRIQPLLAAQDAAEWVSQLTAARVPAGLVNAIDEAFEFADSLGLNAIAEISQGERSSLQVANPIHLSTGPVRYTGLPPTLGEHGGADWLAPAEHLSTTRPPAHRPNSREPS